MGRKMDLSSDYATAELLRTERSLANELLTSTAHSLIQSPLNAVVQIVDRATGSNILPSVQILEAPDPQEFSPTKSHWYAQQFGNALGMTAHFCLINKLAPGKGLQAGEQLALGNGSRIVGRAAALGGLYSAACVPTAETEKDFWTARGRAGVTGALAFATLTASSMSWRAAADSISSSSARNLLKHEAVAGALSGIPAGLVSADSHSLLQGKGFATSAQRIESMYGFAVVGGGLGLVHATENRLGKNKMPARATDPKSEVFGSPDRALNLPEIVQDARKPTGTVADRLGESVDQAQQALRQPEIASLVRKSQEASRQVLRTAGLEKSAGSYAEAIEKLMPEPDYTTKGPEEAVVKAFDVLERTLGGNHPDVLATIDALVAKHHLTGSAYSRHMLPVLETLVRARTSQFGANSAEAANAEIMLGRHHEYSGNWTEAIDTMGRAADIRARVFGPESVERAQVLGWKGGIQDYVGRHAEAEPLLREALDIYEQHGVADSNADAAAVMASLSDAMFRTNQRAAGEAMAWRTIDSAGRLPDVQATLNKAMRVLADIHLFEGKVQDAVTLYNRANKYADTRLRTFTSAARERSHLTGEQSVWNELEPGYNPYLDAFDQINSSPVWSVRQPRLVLTDKYSWSVPNEAALNKIASFGPVVEVGAGTGYWSALLRLRGVDVVAYDAHPIESGTSSFHPRAEQSWTNIAQGSETSAARHGDRTLFLSWPPGGEPMAANTLSSFTGKRLAYVGEGRGGVTGDARFHDLLDTQWSLVDTVEIPQWKGRSDALHIYERNPN